MKLVRNFLGDAKFISIMIASFVHAVEWHSDFHLLLIGSTNIVAITENEIHRWKKEAKRVIMRRWIRRQHSPGFQEHSQRHRRFLPLKGENFYNCELCGVRIAVLQIVTGGNGEGQFKVCGVDQEMAKK